MNRKLRFGPIAVGFGVIAMVGFLFLHSRGKADQEVSREHPSKTFRQGSLVAKQVLKEAIITSVPNKNPRFQRVVTFDPSGSGIGDDFETLMPNMASTLDSSYWDEYIDTVGVILAPDPASMEWNLYAKSLILLSKKKHTYEPLFHWRNQLRERKPWVGGQIAKSISGYSKAELNNAEKTIAHNVAVLRKHNFNLIVVTDGKLLIADISNMLYICDRFFHLRVMQNDEI
jgi:hypothetical protein